MTGKQIRTRDTYSVVSGAGVVPVVKIIQTFRNATVKDEIIRLEMSDDSRRGDLPKSEEIQGHRGPTGAQEFVKSPMRHTYGSYVLLFPDDLVRPVLQNLPEAFGVRPM